MRAQPPTSVLPAMSAAPPTSAASTVPVPPVEMRMLVGPTDEAAFDNPMGRLVLPGLKAAQYQSVFDFGCGCGRLARQLIQQVPRPESYLGIDLHRGMVEWCRANLAPQARGFRFEHHDVYEMAFNPQSSDRTLPFPVVDDQFTLAIAWSVFTHLLEDQVPYYLRELARVLRPDGVATTTWFFFEKDSFPMMQEDQNALFINPVNPTNAVIYDKRWFERAVLDAGLVPVRITAPAIRGYQWTVLLAPAANGEGPAPWPVDGAPVGVARPPRPLVPVHQLGLEGEQAT